MIIRYSESLELPQARRMDVFAFAGRLAVYQTGMTVRDAVKAIMQVRGTGWIKELEECYPAVNDYTTARANRKPRKPRVKKEAPKDAGKSPAKSNATIQH